MFIITINAWGERGGGRGEREGGERGEREGEERGREERGEGLVRVTGKEWEGPGPGREGGGERRGGEQSL